MDTLTLRKLHTDYARPVEPTSFYRLCAEQSAADRILADVFAGKRTQHGPRLSTAGTFTALPVTA